MAKLKQSTRVAHKVPVESSRTQGLQLHSNKYTPSGVDLHTLGNAPFRKPVVNKLLIIDLRIANLPYFDFYFTFYAFLFGNWDFCLLQSAFLLARFLVSTSLLHAFYRSTLGSSNVVPEVPSKDILLIMALSRKFFLRMADSCFRITVRSESILASKVAKTVLQKDIKDIEKIPALKPGSEIPASYKYIYPEFLASSNIIRRNAICEKLVRMDMLKRRTVLNIPEFYPGSILAVTISDPNAPNKSSRFVGICICRGGHGLNAFVILRNVVDGLGVEIMYNLYNPTVREVQVLRLERRLDDQLFYLRDCAPEHSTVPFDLDVTPHPAGVAIPLNETVLKLNPHPWKTRWELYEFRGITFNRDELPLGRAKALDKALAPHEWVKFDIMKKYRNQVALEDQEVMFKDIYQFNNAKLEKRRSRR